MSTVLQSDSHKTWVLAAEWYLTAAVLELRVFRFVRAQAFQGGCWPQPCSHTCRSSWTKSLQAYCAAAASPVNVHVHNYSGFAARRRALESDEVVENGGVTFVLGCDAWSS